MINALHLLWIVPLSACFGVLLIALVSAGNEQEGE